MPVASVSKGPRELKHAPDLKKTNLFSELLDAAQRGSACPSAHSFEDLRVTASVYKTQLCYFSERGSFTKDSRCRHARGVGELRRSLAYLCSRRYRNLGSIDPFSWLITFPRISSELQDKICRQIMRLPNLTPCVFSLMRSQSTPSARASCCDGFSWVSDEPADGMPVRALSVAKDVVFPRDLGLHFPSYGSQSRIFAGGRQRDGLLASTARPRT